MGRQGCRAVKSHCTAVSLTVNDQISLSQTISLFPKLIHAFIKISEFQSGKARMDSRIGRHGKARMQGCQVSQYSSESHCK